MRIINFFFNLRLYVNFVAMKRKLHSTACTAGMILAAAATMLSAASCGQNNGNTTHRNPEGLISVEYADLKKGEDILISEWVGEPEFIALDSRPEAITNGRQFAVSDNYIGIYGKGHETALKLFDRASGNYLRDIGGIGRGPGEYLSISSAQIDEAGGKVWISTLETNKIYSYDIGTGRLIADIELPYKAENNSNNGYNFMVDSLSETITIIPLPFKDKCPSAVWCQDFEGNILWETPETYTMKKNTFLTMNTYRNLHGLTDLSFKSNNTMQDTLYILEDREIRPVLTVKFGETTGEDRVNLDKDKIFSSPYILPDYAVVTISKIAGMRNNGSDFFMEYENLPNVVMDRSTEEVALRNIVDDLMTWKNNSFTFFDGCLVLAYDAPTFKEAGTKALAEGNLSDTAKDQITAILSRLSDNSNNILMIAPLK